MFIKPRITTAYGPVLCDHPKTIVIPASPDNALIFAARVDRQADAMLAEGHYRQAERLSHLALEARCRARGGRA